MTYASRRKAAVGANVSVRSRVVGETWPGEEMALLRRRARRGQGDDVRDDPLDAAQERRVRAVLALGGVPQADLPDGVQQV
ncbi:RNA polymerase subunit sigma-70, partial [Streptomyces anthocyanicus]